MGTEYKEVFNDGKTKKQRIYEYLLSERNEVENNIHFMLESIELKRRKIKKLEADIGYKLSHFLQISENDFVEVKKIREEIKSVEFDMARLIPDYILASKKMSWFTEEKSDSEEI